MFSRTHTRTRTRTQSHSQSRNQHQRRSQSGSYAYDDRNTDLDLDYESLDLSVYPPAQAPAPTSNSGLGPTQTYEYESEYESESAYAYAYASRYRRNLWGWYLYAFASEVFIIVSLALFLPICLEQYAREHGFVFGVGPGPGGGGGGGGSDSSSVAVPCTTSASASARGMAGMGMGAGTEGNWERGGGGGGGGGCMVRIGWLWVDTTSFSLYVYSISVALQAITVISMGGIADHPPHRKRILLTFAALGSISAILFFFLPSSSSSFPTPPSSSFTSTTTSTPTSTTSNTWLLSAPLAILANIGLGASIVAMNAYIPGLARRAPEVVGLGFGLGGGRGRGSLRGRASKPGVRGEGEEEGEAGASLIDDDEDDLNETEDSEGEEVTKKKKKDANVVVVDVDERECLLSSSLDESEEGRSGEDPSARPSASTPLLGCPRPRPRVSQTRTRTSADSTSPSPPLRLSSSSSSSSSSSASSRGSIGIDRRSARRLQSNLNLKHPQPGPAAGPEPEPERASRMMTYTRLQVDELKVPQQRRDQKQEQQERVEARDQEERAYQTALSRTTARISSYGIAIGYAAGISVLGLVLLVMRLFVINGDGGGGGMRTTDADADALRMAIGASGVWWALFTIPAGMWLPDSDYPSSSTSRSSAVTVRSMGGRGGQFRRPGEGERLEMSVVEGEGEGEKTREWKVSKEIGDAWVRLGNMLRWREINKLRNTFKFLAAWFFLSDGLTTISSTTLLFSKTTLQMTPSSLVVIGLLTPTSGILSSLLLPYIQRRYGFSTQRILLLLGLMASFVPLYGVLGLFLTGTVRTASSTSITTTTATTLGKWKWGGLTTQSEMYVVAVYFGAVYAAFQGYARAFYAELLPPTDGARWYALFSIAGKSSSFIGPLIVGLISDTTGNIRFSFVALVCMIWAALPVLASVDVERGRRDARGYQYAQEDGEDEHEDHECYGSH